MKKARAVTRANLSTGGANSIVTDGPICADPSCPSLDYEVVPNANGRPHTIFCRECAASYPLSPAPDGWGKA